MRTIDSIIIHCTDSPDTRDFGVEDIERWHCERAIKEPWSAYIDAEGNTRFIGYHYVVKRDGTVEPGRPEHEVGCHCKGHNARSIGVVWVGRQSPSDQQIGALVSFVANLCIAHALTSEDVHGHNAFTSFKTCPNLDMDFFKSAVEMTIRDLK